MTSTCHNAKRAASRHRCTVTAGALRGPSEPRRALCVACLRPTSRWPRCSRPTKARDECEWQTGVEVSIAFVRAQGRMGWTSGWNRWGRSLRGIPRGAPLFAPLFPTARRGAAGPARGPGSRAPTCFQSVYGGVFVGRRRRRLVSDPRSTFLIFRHGRGSDIDQGARQGPCRSARVRCRRRPCGVLRGRHRRAGAKAWPRHRDLRQRRPLRRPLCVRRQVRRRPPVRDAPCVSRSEPWRRRRPPFVDRTRRSGSGCWYFADGASLRGVFVDGALHGRGVYTYPDGASTGTVVPALV